jgi:hypothetical protein
MFTKQKVNFSPTNQITHLVVGGNTIVLAMANNVLLRINLNAPDVLEGNFSFYFERLTIGWADVYSLSTSTQNYWKETQPVGNYVFTYY